MTFLEHTDGLAQAFATVNYRITPFVGSGRWPDVGSHIPHYLGRFRVLNEIARGGMGIVLRAYDTDLDREVAVKLLSPAIQPDTEMGLHFAQEARVASQLRHPGIMPVYESGSLPDGRSYFVMPLISGETLASKLSRRTHLGHGLRRWLRLFDQVCHAVAYAHQQGIVHRDLKPGNVIVGKDGTALVLDWGVAATAQRDGDAGTEGGCWIFGTPAYMPPEQAQGKSHGADPRADVFGLGAILCEIVTGLPPYVSTDAATVSQMAAVGSLHDCHRRLHQSGAPQEVVELAIHCLAAEPAARPGDARAVCRKLASIRGGLAAQRRQPCRLPHC